MTDLNYPMAVAKVSEESGGGFIAQAIDLKGCIGDGDTPEEAIINLKEAILEWLDEARRLGREIPAPGSAIARAHKDRQEMIALIRQQEEVIGRQADSFAALQGEVARLSAQVSALAAEPDVPGWEYIGTPVKCDYSKNNGGLPH